MVNMASETAAKGGFIAGIIKGVVSMGVGAGVEEPAGTIGNTAPIAGIPSIPIMPPGVAVAFVGGGRGGGIPPAAAAAAIEAMNSDEYAAWKIAGSPNEEAEAAAEAAAAAAAAAADAAADAYTFGDAGGTLCDGLVSPGRRRFLVGPDSDSPA